MRSKLIVEILHYGNVARAQQQGIDLVELLSFYNGSGIWGAKNLQWQHTYTEAFGVLCLLLHDSDFIRNKHHFLEWCSVPEYVIMYVASGRKFTNSLISKLDTHIVRQAIIGNMVPDHVGAHQLNGRKTTVYQLINADILSFPQLDISFMKNKNILKFVLERAFQLKSHAPLYWELVEAEYRKFFHKYSEQFYDPSDDNASSFNQQLVFNIADTFGSDFFEQFWSTTFPKAYHRASVTIQNYLLGFDPFAHIVTKEQRDERLKILLKLGPEKFVEHLQESWPEVHGINTENVFMDPLTEFHPCDRLYLGFSDKQLWCFTRSEWKSMLQSKNLIYCRNPLTEGNLNLIQNRLLLTSEFPTAGTLETILKSFAKSSSPGRVSSKTTPAEDDDTRPRQRPPIYRLSRPIITHSSTDSSPVEDDDTLGLPNSRPRVHPRHLIPFIPRSHITHSSSDASSSSSSSDDDA